MASVGEGFQLRLGVRGPQREPCTGRPSRDIPRSEVLERTRAPLSGGTAGKALAPKSNEP